MAPIEWEEQARTMTAETFRPFIRAAGRHVGRRRTQVEDVVHILYDHGFGGSQAQMVFDAWLDMQEQSDPEMAALQAREAEVQARIEPVDPATRRAVARSPRARVTADEETILGAEMCLAGIHAAMESQRERHAATWMESHSEDLRTIVWEEAAALVAVRQEAARG